MASNNAEPHSKPELVDALMKSISKNVDLTDIFRVKRAGADLNDLFYMYGKIHGLENIAFVPDEVLAKCGGHPVLLQAAINDVEGKSRFFGSFEEMVADNSQLLDAYKAGVSKIGMNPSDRKKMLSLPFFLAKRA